MHFSSRGLPSARRTWRAGTLTYTSAGLVALFVWLLLGDFSWSMRDRSVLPMAQWYMTHLAVPNLLFGLLLVSVPAAFTLVLGPVVSVMSDRHRSSRGRRLPFLLFTTPIGALSMIGMGVTPLLARSLHDWAGGLGVGASEKILALAVFAFFWAMFEFATIAGQAVLGGLINDVVPQVLLGRFYGLFRAVSLIDGMIFNFWLMGKIPDHYTLILVVVGVFYGVAFTFVCLKVKEGDYPPVDEAATKPRHAWAEEVRRYFRECFSNPYYVSIFGIFMLAGMAFGPVNMFSIPYAQSLDVDMDAYGKAMALTFLISFVFSYFIGWLVDIFHPLRMVMVSLAAYVLVAIWGSFFIKDESTFLTGWVMHGVVSGLYFTCVASLGQRLFPQLRFAQFSSAAGIGMALANMAMAPLMGGILDQAKGGFHYTFLAGLVLSVLALGMTWHVYREFRKLGGPDHYTPPA